MTSQVIPFIESATANFQFQATIDGQVYNIVCTFNAYAQRYYVGIYDLSQNLVMLRPMVASPDWFNINLGAGYFTDSIVFRDSSQSFEIPGIPPTATLVTRPSMPAV